jgi:hypothetical protein
MTWKYINSRGTVQPNRTDMPPDTGPKQLKLKRGDVRGEDQGRFDHISLEDWMRSLHANMGPQPTEGKFLMMTTTTP